MNNLTQRENPLLYWFCKVGDFCALSIVWMLLCLPVVTVIPASIALYDSVAHCVQGPEDGCIPRFFRTLKKELLRGVLLNLVWLVVGFMLVWGYSILYQLGKEQPVIATYSLVYLCSMLIPMGILCWLIPVESRFQHSFFGLFRSAAVYAICHLPTTIMLVIILVLSIILVLILPILAMLMPGIAVTIQCWFIERVFKKYIPMEDDADEVVG